jgi:hypothetical protein
MTRITEGHLVRHNQGVKGGRDLRFLAKLIARVEQFWSRRR